MGLPHQIKIGKGLGTVAEETLRFYAQIGVEHVGLPLRYSTKVGARPLVPPAQTGPAGPLGAPWDEPELHRIRERIEYFGLTPSETRLPLSGNTALANDGRKGGNAYFRAFLQNSFEAASLEKRLIERDPGPRLIGRGTSADDGSFRPVEPDRTKLDFVLPAAAVEYGYAVALAESEHVAQSVEEDVREGDSPFRKAFPGQKEAVHGNRFPDVGPVRTER